MTPTTARKSRLKCAWSNQPSEAARPGQVVDLAGVDGGGGVLQPVPGEHRLRADPDVRREQPLQRPDAHRAERGDLVHPHQRAVLDHRGDQAEQVDVGVRRLGRPRQEGGVEDGGAGVVVVLGQDGGQQAAGRERRARARAGRRCRGPGSTPVNAANPPGRNFTALTRPAPVRSTVNRRVTTPCRSTAGIATPNRGSVPDSTERFTLGWLSTSERNGGCPVRSQRTDQYRSTKGRSGSETGRRGAGRPARRSRRGAGPRAGSPPGRGLSRSSKTPRRQRRQHRGHDDHRRKARGLHHPDPVPRLLAGRRGDPLLRGGVRRHASSAAWTGPATR